MISRKLGLSPCKTAKDIPDIGLRYAELFGDRSLGTPIRGQAANPFYLVISEFCPAMLLATPQAFWIDSGSIALSVSASSLRVTILGIIQVCPRPQMGGVAARPVIAFMQHIQPRGDRAFYQLVGYAMCGNGTSKRLECTIPLVGARLPGPALVWPPHINLRPEAFFERFSHVSSIKETPLARQVLSRDCVRPKGVKKEITCRNAGVPRQTHYSVA